MTSLADAIARVAAAPLEPPSRPPAITITPDVVWPKDAPRHESPLDLAGWKVAVSDLIGDDALAVARLTEAGAVVARVAAPALGLDSATAAGLAAAAVGGGSSAALVTDTEGSARLAAAHHGVLAFKPTLHTVPLDHWTTVSWTMDDIVPLAGSVADVATLLDVVTGAGCWRSVLDAELPAPAAGGLELVTDEDLDVALAAARVLSRAQAAQYHAERGTDLCVLPPRLQAELELATTIPAAVYIRSLRLRHQLLERVATIFERVDVLSMPTTPRTCVLASLLNLPAVTLPSGTQLVGAPGHDAHLLHAAHARCRPGQ
jgi:Asp-tRNA(Asn)/Glu-tRNA(Gln) amidotransferase A subunit family amidase